MKTNIDDCLINIVLSSIRGGFMAEIKCPKCGEVFQVDENDYAKILSQVRDQQFEKELKERVGQVEAKNKADSELAEMKLKEKLQEEVSKLKQELFEMKVKLNNAEKDKKADIEKAELNKDKVIDQLKKDIEINIVQKELEKKKLIELHTKEIQAKDDQIAFYRDFKAKSNVKLLGETLEQHCQNAFNSIRVTAYPNAYFEKDNDVVEGSKGDYIFREMISENEELISIMFDMKNEGDETATKHKNEDFLEKLDKDRKKKGCEYAVLVSMLEPDNDFYNAGIVDMSYRYPKMYVVRPQCFLTIISVLYMAAKNAAKYKNELAIVKEQNIDITNFENELLDFQTKFDNNFRLAKERFTKAIEEIDKTIDHLQKVKDGLLGADRQLRLANDKAQDLSIKKLTHDNPTMKKMFDDLKKED